MSDTAWPNIMPPYPEAEPEPVSQPVEPEPEPETTRRSSRGVEQSYCEVCEKWYSKKWLYSHRRKAHGIYGGKSGRGRKPGSKNKPKPTMEIAAPTSHKAERLAPLTAEQITRAAAEALWPKGIPHDHLTALLRWNIQTHYFLAEVMQ